MQQVAASVSHPLVELVQASYYRARYYDPTVGRFSNGDPLGIFGGVNLYVYAENEPIRRADPFGLTWVYSQSSGALYYVWDNFGDPDPSHTIVVYVGSGYAGHGSGVNNPSSQCVLGDPEFRVRPILVYNRS